MVPCKKVLVTGFSPFGGEQVNPSWETVKRLPDRMRGAELIKLEIPTSFAKCGLAIENASEANRPDAVLCVGQAGGRAGISVERVAINLAEASIPDNDGAQPLGEPIQAEGPAAYFATLPVKAMARNIRAHGIPCHISYSAGTYVCNCVMYQTLYLAGRKYPNLRAGFLHVPYLHEQAAGKPVGTPSMDIPTLVRALELAVEAIITNPQDIHAGMGATC